MSLLSLFLSFFTGLLITSISREEDSAFSKNKHVLEVLELLIYSENSLMKSNQSDDRFRINSIISQFCKNALSSEVSKIWAVSVDPIEGIQYLYNDFDENIKLKPSDYMFTGREPWNEIYVKNALGEGFYVTLKKNISSDIILVAAKREQSVTEVLWNVCRSSAFSILLALAVFVFFALFVRNRLCRSFGQFNKTLNDIINNQEADSNLANNYLWKPQIDLLAKIRSMKANLIALFYEAKAEKEKAEVVLERLQNGVIAVSIDHRIMLVNIMAEKITGYSGENIIGKKFADVFKLVNLKTGEVVPSPVDMVLNDNVDLNVNSRFKFIKSNGEDMIIALSASSVIYDSAGTKEVIIVIRDITTEVLNLEQLKKVNEKLISNAENIHFLFDVAKIATWELDIETNIIYAEKEYYDLLHFKQKKRINFYDELIPRINNSEDILEVFNDLPALTDEGFATCLSVQGDDGINRRMLCCGKMCGSGGKDATGRIYGLIIDVDVGENSGSKSGYQSQVNSVGNKRLQQVYELARLFFWEYDVKRDLITGDNNFVKIFKKFGDNIQSGTLNMALQHIEPGSLNELRKVVAEAVANQSKSCTAEFITVPDKDGHTGYMRNYLNFDYDKVGVLVSSYGVVLDITDEHERQLKLSHTSKMESIGALAGGIAYDFENIFSGILSLLELLEKNVKDSENKAFDCCVKIRKLCEKAGDFTKKLLLFSRKDKAEHEEFNLNEVVENTVVILKHSITNHIEIDYNSFLTEAFIRGNITELQNLILNIGINARDAILEKENSINSFNGLISIRVLKYNPAVFNSSLICGEINHEIDYVVIEVEDNGIGIRADSVDKILDPFYTTKFEGKGTGLGLSLLENTMSTHRGAVCVESKESVGSVVSIILPLLMKYNDVDHKTAKLSEIQRKSVSVKQGQGDKGVVLIVDDEPVMRFIYKQLLSEQGYRVIEAVNGRDGISKYVENHGLITGIILDLQMAEMDGKEAFRKILEFDKDIKVVFVSGYLSKDSKQELLDMGAAGVLSKPFRKKVFVQSIDILFAKAPNII